MQIWCRCWSELDVVSPFGGTLLLARSERNRDLAGTRGSYSLVGDAIFVEESGRVSRVFAFGES